MHGFGGWLLTIKLSNVVWKSQKASNLHWIGSKPIASVSWATRLLNSGAWGRTRTYDQRLIKALLYQLSYTSMVGLSLCHVH